MKKSTDTQQLCVCDKHVVHIQSHSNHFDHSLLKEDIFIRLFYRWWLYDYSTGGDSKSVAQRSVPANDQRRLFSTNANKNLVAVEYEATRSITTSHWWAGSPLQDIVAGFSSNNQFPLFFT